MKATDRPRVDGLTIHWDLEMDSQSDHPVFKASDGSVYADLLNAALSEVNWHEIADSLLETEKDNADDPTDDDSVAHYANN